MLIKYYSADYRVTELQLHGHMKYQFTLYTPLYIIIRGHHYLGSGAQLKNKIGSKILKRGVKNILNRAQMGGGGESKYKFCENGGSKYRSYENGGERVEGQN